jgi:two-component system chemotaxis response regulator CheB
MTPPVWRPEPPAALIVIGSSAGGLHALRRIVEDLPPVLSAAVIVAQHGGERGLLTDLIGGWTPLPAVEIEDGMALAGGRVHVCPPGYHLIVNPDTTLALQADERLGLGRPSLDWLLHSASATFGQRLVAVLLSGASADGARGVIAVRQANGRTIVQSPAQCAYPRMPAASIDTGMVDDVLPVTAAAPAVVNRLERLDLAELCRQWEEPFIPAGPSPVS